MKRIIFVVIVMFFCSRQAFPQLVGVLDDDARIVCGTMPNGLSYYLVNNSSLKGYADFAFVRMSGVAMEDSSTKGMTYLMECMALTETVNFPDGAIFTFMDDMGLSRSDGLVIDAGDYYTTYTFSDVPVSKNGSMVDSMLLALYNMSSALVIDDRSVERGKNFFRNVFSAGYTMEHRIRDSIVRYCCAGTPLAPAGQDELFAMVDSYSTDDVAAFYKAVCRPDMQAIVVVGDIDVASVESKIQALFQVIPKPDTPLQEFPDSIMDISEGGWFYFKDKEADCARITVDYMLDPVDKSLRNTAVPFIYGYVSSVGMDIMRKRMDRALEDAPFYASEVYVGIVPFLNRYSCRFSIECAPEDYTQAYVLILNEIERLVKYGVSGEEFRSSSDRFVADLRDTYDRRSSLDNKYYRNLCVSNFTDGYVMAGIELYKSYIEAAAPLVDSSTVYDFLSAVFADTGSRIVVCSSPEPSAGLEYFAAGPRPFTDDVPQWSPERARAGQGLKDWKEHCFVNKSTGVISRRLPNGAMVAYRKMDTEPGRVYFEAVARGGVSLSSDDASVLHRYVNDVADISVIGGMNRYRLGRLKESLDIQLDRRISVGDRRLSGSFPVERMDDFMQLAALYFRGSSPDSATFLKYRSMLQGCRPYRNNSPEKLFDRLRRMDIRAEAGNMWREDPAMDSLDYGKALDFVNGLFSNAAEFSFFFVGDFPEDELLESVYFAFSDLPGRRTGNARGENRTFYIASYNDVTEIEVPMESPRRLHSCRITIPSDLNVEDRMLSAVTAKVIEREVIRQLSLHGILAESNTRYYRFPEEVLTIEFNFSTYQEADDLEQLFADIVVELADRGVSANEVDAVRRNMLLKDALRESRDYSFWQNVMNSRYVDRKDFYTRRKTALEALTADDVNGYLETVLDEGRISLLSVVPENTVDGYGNNVDNR